MPRLVIDNLEIEVPQGIKVIDAAERLGIMIPRFCYHEALGAVGACRMCAVKFLQGPFKGVQMSCMIDAQEGMVVSTTDEEAVQFRRRMIELLMLNHPHDCPVCDEGGQCLLQDETVSGGHGLRRYRGKKRTYRDQYLGPYIEHEMNRCIHCYRCSRYYQEFSGYRDLGPMQTANRVYFGRFSDGRLESPFSGNLVDICPTGVYTDKTARFKVRRWDLQRAPSVCNLCSLGCNTIGNSHYRSVMRIEARLNRYVNGYFICDAGRFGFSYANGGADHRSRPWAPRIDGSDADAKSTLSLAADRLAAIAKQAGSKAIATVGSCRNSLETQIMLKHVCGTNQWRDPAFFADTASFRKARTAVERLDARIAFSMRQIEVSDFVIIAGADLLNEAPMAALAVRQASRKKAPVIVIDPRPVSLPMDFEHIPAAPDDIEHYLGAMVRGSIESDAGQFGHDAAEFCENLPRKCRDGLLQERIESLSLSLRASRRPAIICGTDIVRESTPAFAADCALLLRHEIKEAGLFYILQGAGSFGAALLSSAQGPVFADIIEEIEKGAVRALIAVESDPFRFFPDRKRLDAALAKLELLFVIDYLPTETVKRASLFYPSSTIFETDSTLVNQEGRAQCASRVHSGGVPLWGEHPPHLFRDFIPGGEHLPAWEILQEIGCSTNAGEMSTRISPRELFTAGHPLLKRLDVEEHPACGIRIIPEKSSAEFHVPTGGGKIAEEREGMELLPVEWLYSTAELCAWSDTMHESRVAPVLYVQASDAERAGFSDGDTVSIELESGTIQVEAAVSNRMAQGVLILPRHPSLDWRKGTLPARIALQKMTKG